MNFPLDTVMSVPIIYFELFQNVKLRCNLALKLQIIPARNESPFGSSPSIFRDSVLGQSGSVALPIPVNYIKMLLHTE